MVRRQTPAIFQRAEARFRAARLRQVQNIIDGLVDRHGTIKFLDAGGSAEYWDMLSPSVADKEHLTILNYSEDLIDYSQLTSVHVPHKNVVGDACSMPQFADGAFHLVHSNSVVKHVGGYGRMIAFAREIRRVVQTSYPQTPNFWFPIDPRIAFPVLHRLPDAWRMLVHTRWPVGLVQRLDFTGAASLLDDSRMIGQRTMWALFLDAQHSAERFAPIFKKSLFASRVD